PFSHFFFSTHTPSTEIYTLSLHDALPICRLRLSPLGQHAVQATRPAYSHEQPGAAQGRNRRVRRAKLRPTVGRVPIVLERRLQQDRKSTRLNSSHVAISYAVFCLKKKKKQ